MNIIRHFVRKPVSDFVGKLRSGLMMTLLTYPGESSAYNPITSPTSLSSLATPATLTLTPLRLYPSSPPSNPFRVPTYSFATSPPVTFQASTFCYNTTKKPPSPPFLHVYKPLILSLTYIISPGTSFHSGGGLLTTYDTVRCSLMSTTKIQRRQYK